VAAAVVGRALAPVVVSRLSFAQDDLDGHHAVGIGGRCHAQLAAVDTHLEIADSPAASTTPR
jgi:hypothetical protein